MAASSTFLDRAQMTVTGTPGTGTITLNAATTGRQSFASAGVTNGAIVSYLIEDGSNWEFGRGTYTTSGTTLARTKILGSSNSGSAISASSSAIVSATLLAEDLTAYQTNIMQFGADPTGTNDNSAAIAAALATLPSEGGTIYFPPGTYKVTSQVTFTMTSGYQNVTLVGAGADATVLYWNASHGLNFVVSSPLNSLNMRDMSITTGAAGSYNGVTFAYSTSIAPTSYLQSQSMFERVTFRDNVNQISGSNYWANAVLLGVSYVNFVSCIFFGIGKAGNGVQITGQTVSGTTNATTATSSNVLHFATTPTGIINGMYALDNTTPTALTGLLSVTGTGVGTVNLSANVPVMVQSGDAIVFTTYAVDINFMGCSFNNLAEGVQIGTGAQGITFVGTTFLDCAVGIYSDGFTGISEVSVGSGCEFACSEWGVVLLGANGTSGGHDDGAYVSNSLFFNTDGTGTFASVYSNFSSTVVTSNCFEGVSGALGIYCNGGGGYIGSNYFETFSTAIKLDSLSAGIFVGPNAFLSVTTECSNSGTGNGVGSAATWLRGDNSWAQPVMAHATPSNPSNTTSTTGIMLGLGGSCTITPSATGRVLIIMCGSAGYGASSFGTNSSTLTLRYGTGVAPSAGAAQSGTVVLTQFLGGGNSASANMPFNMSTVITGLTVGTAYWFDIGEKTSTTANACSIAGPTFSAVEL